MRAEDANASASYAPMPRGLRKLRATGREPAVSIERVPRVGSRHHVKYRECDAGVSNLSAILQAGPACEMATATVRPCVRPCEILPRIGPRWGRRGRLPHPGML